MIQLEVIQPQNVKLEKEFDHVIIPGVEGDFGVSEGHTPFLTRIRPGVLQVFENMNGEAETLAVHDGFAMVEPKKVTIVCETVEYSKEIDAKRAEAAKERAEQRLKEKPDDMNFRRAELALAKAIARISARK